MKFSSTLLKKQSGESNLVPRSCKGKSKAKKREREDTDSKDAGQALENRENSQKRYLQKNKTKKAQISMKKQLKLKAQQLICKNDNRPMKALWEALNDKDTPGIEIIMAIVKNPRCGLERRAEREDELANSKGTELIHSTPLMLAVQAHRNDVIEALLAAGASTSSHGFSWTAFLVAAFNGNVTAMDLLFRYGADPFVVGNYGSSALHYAAIKGRRHAIQVLVELGASTDEGDDDRKTPLFRTADGPCSAALLDNGANLEAVDRYGMTALHFAITWGHIGAIEVLVWEGASITAIDKWGRSPLEIFSRHRRKRYTNAEHARVLALLTPTLLH